MSLSARIAALVVIVFSCVFGAISQPLEASATACTKHGSTFDCQGTINYFSTVTGTVKSESGSSDIDLWTLDARQDEVVRIHATASSGEVRVYVVNQAGQNVAVSNGNAPVIFRVPEDGVYDVTVGPTWHFETSYTMDIAEDHVAPTVTPRFSVAKNAAGWHKRDTTVTIRATDNHAGVTEVGYWYSDINGNRASNGGPSIKFVANREGIHGWGYWAKDAFGNTAYFNTNSSQNGGTEIEPLKLDKIRPIVTAPTYSFDASALSTAGKVRVILSWSGYDPAPNAYQLGSGITKWELQFGRFVQLSDGSYTLKWTPVKLDSTSCTSDNTSCTKMLGLNANALVYTRVRAIDAAGSNSAGNVGSWMEGAPLLPGSESEIGHGVSYTGRWWRQAITNAHEGYVKYSKTAGAKAHFNFHGSRALWLTMKYSNGGTAKVYVDGVYKTTVALSNPTTLKKVVGYDTGALADGNHTLTIEVVGGRVDVDAFAFIGTPPPAP